MEKYIEKRLTCHEADSLLHTWKNVLHCGQTIARDDIYWNMQTGEILWKCIYGDSHARLLKA
jgi:hypothetical protein